MTVQELYDYALKHGITGCPVRIHVLHNDEFIEFMSEHLDLVTYQDDTEEIDGYLGLWVRRDKAENVWSAKSYAEHAEWQTCINEEDSGFVQCSKCHAKFHTDDLERVGNDKGFVNYCPACCTWMIDYD